jgi:hypothetical protein
MKLVIYIYGISTKDVQSVRISDSYLKNFELTIHSREVLRPTAISKYTDSAHN